MKHLYTLTGNLLAEFTATYDAVEWNRTHRANDERFQVGGKGINVAKMARRLGIPSTAVCFPGGYIGKLCLAWLNAQDFSVAPFFQETDTRAGWVVRSGQSETTFLGRDRELEEGPWMEALRFLEKEIEAEDVLAICGSLPGWRASLKEPCMRLLGNRCRNVFMTVDTYGPALNDLLETKVDLLKINRDEFTALLSRKQLPEKDWEAHLSMAAEMFPNVQRWVITAGGGPVVARDADGEIFSMDPPAVRIVSAVGCGDVLLAGLIHGLVWQGLSLPRALKQALPLAAANAASAGIADFEF